MWYKFFTFPKQFYAPNFPRSAGLATLALAVNPHESNPRFLPDHTCSITIDRLLIGVKFCGERGKPQWTCWLVHVSVRVWYGYITYLLFIGRSLDGCVCCFSEFLYFFCFRLDKNVVRDSASVCYYFCAGVYPSSMDVYLQPITF